MIKYLIVDVDGTLTDGKIYMGANGEIMKAFSVKDGYAINFILKPANIIPIVITARKSAIVEQRCREIGIEQVYQGKIEKLPVLKEIVGEKSIGDCAYFGDDILDLACMSSIKKGGGIIGCPADAVQEVKEIANYICIHKAGEGAFREFCEWIINKRKNNENVVKEALEYLKLVDIDKSEIGKKYVVNDKFFYTVQSYMTKPENECKLESHSRHIDIQLIVEGQEAMDVVDVSRVSIRQSYDLENDIAYWNVPEQMSRVLLKEGSYMILYPENAHRGAVANEQSEHVIKIVGKVMY